MTTREIIKNSSDQLCLICRLSITFSLRSRNGTLYGIGNILSLFVCKYSHIPFLCDVQNPISRRNALTRHFAIRCHQTVHHSLPVHKNETVQRFVHNSIFPLTSDTHVTCPSLGGKCRCDVYVFCSLALNLNARWGVFFVRGTGLSMTSILFEIIYKRLY